MEPTEKLIAGAFVTVVGVGMLGTCSRDRSSHETIQYTSSSRPAISDFSTSSDRAAAGVINLNEVRDAFRATHEMAVFEQRVNEIYEGEQMVVFEAKEARGGFKMLGRDDLDASKSTTSDDDLLFTLSVKGREATLQGHGVNSYYKETWLYEPPADAATRVTEVHHRSSISSSPFFWYWMLSPGWGGYYTPMSRYNSMYTHRNTYRRSSAYSGQRSRNTSYTRGSSFRSASNTMSSQRKSYVKNSPSASGYKQKVAASAKRNGTSATSQKRSSSSSKKNSFSGSSRKSSSSRSYGGFSGSSGF